MHTGGWGGGMIAFVAVAHMVDATSLTLVVALAHMVDATSLTLVVALAHRGVGGWDDNVRCSCTHGWCYVFNFSCCTCTHGWCYVFNFSCYTCTQGGWGGGMITFVAVAHMVDATSLTLLVALAHMVDATSLTLVVAHLRCLHLRWAISCNHVFSLKDFKAEGWKKWRSASCNQKITWNVKVLNVRSFKFKFL